MPNTAAHFSRDLLQGAAANGSGIVSLNSPGRILRDPDISPGHSLYPGHFLLPGNSPPFLSWCRAFPLPLPPSAKRSAVNVYNIDSGYRVRNMSHLVSVL